MARDQYNSFSELAASEVCGEDYKVFVQDMGSDVLIMAPHGGKIEPGTSEIACAVAGTEYSIYAFEGLRSGRRHQDLHITSTLFDEPHAIQIAQACRKVVAVHGRADRNDSDTIWIGGLDVELANSIEVSLKAALFKATKSVQLAGKHPSNICNRSGSRMGVQLEVPRSVRDLLMKDETAMMKLAEAIRGVLKEG